MRRKSSLLILALASLALTVLRPAAARAADIHGGLAYVPHSAFAVVGIDADRLRAKPVYRKALELVKADPGVAKELRELRKGIGVDLLTQTHALLFAFDPTVVDDDDHFVMIAEAQVSESKLVSFVRGKGTKLEARQGPGGRYYLIGKRGKGALAVRAGRVLVGGRATLLSALKRRGPGPALRRALGRVTGHDLFMAALPTTKVRRKLEREHPGFGGITRLVASADLAAGLRLAMSARLLTANKARALAAEANDVLRKARRERQTKALGLSGLIDAIEVSSVGRELNARIDLPAKQLDGIVGMLETLLLH